MIPRGAEWSEIAQTAEGDLREIPYSVLLAALARAGRTAMLEMVRKPVGKQIAVVEGTPVECRSNLAHETFGRFLLSAGKLTEADHRTALSESLSRGVPLGEILLERGVLSPQEVYRNLQQNLARKLLDGFTWTEGTFRLSAEVSAVDRTVKLNAPQLILTGILKLSPPSEIRSGIAEFVADPLALEPEPPLAATLKFGPGAAKLLRSLQERPANLDELAARTRLSGDEVGRVVYALAVLGVVAPASEVRERAAPAGAAAPAGPTEPRAAESADDQEMLLRQSKILEAYLSFRRKDAFDFLGLPEDADLREIEKAYLEAAQTYAPWVLEEHGSPDFAEQARLLFLSAAEAFTELKKTESRGALIHRRKVLREEQESRRKARFKIETDLLDPEVQFRKGQDLLAEGDLHKALEFLQFAADCDPQNPVYRSEVAYCRYRFSPGQHLDSALADLKEALRIDPRCGLALYYLGMIHLEEGNPEEAEARLQPAVKLMAPDRRPIEALRELSRKKRKK